MSTKIRFLRMARGSAYESICHARIYYIEESSEIRDIQNLAVILDSYIIRLI